MGPWMSKLNLIDISVRTNIAIIVSHYNTISSENEMLCHYNRIFFVCFWWQLCTAVQPDGFSSCTSEQLCSSFLPPPQPNLPCDSRLIYSSNHWCSFTAGLQCWREALRCGGDVSQQCAVTRIHGLHSPKPCESVMCSVTHRIADRQKLSLYEQ